VFQVTNGVIVAVAAAVALIVTSVDEFKVCDVEFSADED
jgi:hypothetical protein